MSIIKVSTSELRSGSKALNDIVSQLGQVDDHLQSSKVANSLYEAQLKSKFNDIISGSFSVNSRLQNRSAELSAELLDRAGKFEQANQVVFSLIEATSGAWKTNSKASGIGLFSTFRKIKSALLWSLGGFLASSLYRLISWIPRIQNLYIIGKSNVQNLTPLDPNAEPEATETSLITNENYQIPLGSLSGKYESTGAPGSVSSGKGDPGGVSYGAYQMTSKGGGRVAEFLNSSSGSPWAAEFENLIPGSEEFSAKWRIVADREPDTFLMAQHDFIKKTHYDPYIIKLGSMGLDVNSRSHALKEVIWSTSVQHGPGNDVLDSFLHSKHVESLTDEEIIRAVYAERGRRTSDGILVRFRSSSSSVQEGVSKRFENELQDALRMLNDEILKKN